MNRGSFGCLLEIAETLILTVVIFFLIQNFVAQPYRVEQQSMQDTLEPGQYVLVDKLTPRFDPYKRGDIVVFHQPDEGGAGGTPFIKRVVGVPGDAVTIEDGSVFVNGQALSEPYVKDGETTDGADESQVTVVDDTLFVLGDHRSNSTDSRVFGSIPSSSVIGRAWLRYWPLSSLGILETPRYGNVAAGASASPAATSPLP